MRPRSVPVRLHVHAERLFLTVPETLEQFSQFLSSSTSPSLVMLPKCSLGRVPKLLYFSLLLLLFFKVESLSEFFEQSELAVQAGDQCQAQYNQDAIADALSDLSPFVIIHSSKEPSIATRLIPHIHPIVKLESRRHFTIRLIIRICNHEHPLGVLDRVRFPEGRLQIARDYRPLCLVP